MIAKPRRGRERLQSFVISGMSPEDIPGVLEIESVSFPTPWSESAFRYELQENPYASLFVAKTRENSRVIAFASRATDRSTLRMRGGYPQKRTSVSAYDPDILSACYRLARICLNRDSAMGYTRATQSVAVARPSGLSWFVV